MKKIIIAIVVISVVSAGYWLISPLFINKEVNESVEDIGKSGFGVKQNGTSVSPLPIPTANTVAEGSFERQGSHNAEGTVKLLKVGDRYFVRFEDDFKLTNGPDLFIYFGKNDVYDSTAKIAPLKGNIGGQNYEVPAGIDPKNYTEIWVWCRAFGVPFAKADLK